LSGGRDYGRATPLTPRELADEIASLLEAASFPLPRFEPPIMAALAALAAALRGGADAAAVARSVHLLDDELLTYGEKMADCFERLLPQLRVCLAANYTLQDDESNWSLSWCIPSLQAANNTVSSPKTRLKQPKPCKQRRCEREIIRTLCRHLNAVGVHFIELRRWRYRSAALEWVLQMVHDLHASVALPAARPPDPAGNVVVRDLVAALQGPLVGLLKRCPCSSLQHVALGTLLRMREEFAQKRTQRAFKAAKHGRFFSIYQHMLLGTHPVAPNGYPEFHGSDDYPLSASESAKILPPNAAARAVPVRPGTITVALHEAVHHIRVHL
jgi:hypothetical protein